MLIAPAGDALLARWARLKDPVGVIKGFARHVADRDARLILAGPSPEAAAAGVLLGSVTQRLLHTAPCPMLVVPHGDRS